MKKIVAFIVLSLSLVSTSLVAQNKEEEKEWKKKLKEMDPMAFKAKMDELESLKKQTAEKDVEITALKEKNLLLESESAKNTQVVDSLKAVVAHKATAPKAGLLTKNPARDNSAVPAGSTPGIIFKVQIGSFKNKDLEKYFNNSKNFSGDVDSDGTKKYTLGNFTEYWEADNFKKYLREMGVHDAWIVSYKDGKRVDIKDVLEGIVK